MSEAANKRIVERLFAAMSALELDVIDELVSREVVDHAPMSGEPVFVPEALKRMAQQFMAGFPDLQMTLEHVMAEGDKVSCVEYSRGTHTGEFMGMPPTGKAMEYRAAHIVRIANGQIVERWAVRGAPEV